MEQLNDKEQTLDMLEAYGDFEIIPCEKLPNFGNSNLFAKLELSSAQKMQVSALLQHAPSAAASGIMAKAYMVKFPKGLPHTLTKLHQGGVGSIIRENGKIVGSASFYSLQTQAIVLGAFTAMSVITGQFFLVQINKELNKINMKLDEILAFLYGDKKAELIAEMKFVKYAYENYSSIMSHEQQRIATIASLQEARKVAMQDIEFYIYDLENTVGELPQSRGYAGLVPKIKKSFQTQECLELSQQLYIMSSMMEIYFAQNQDTEYSKFIEKDILESINKCNRRMLKCFSTLSRDVEKSKEKQAENDDKSKQKQSITSLIASLENEEETPMQKEVRLALNANKTEYYLTGDGDIFIKREINL